MTKPPKIKKIAAALTTEKLTAREQRDVAAWLEMLAKKFRKGQITQDEMFSSGLNYY